MFSNYISSESFYNNFKLFKSNHTLITELGDSINELQIGYHTYGTYQKNKSKVVWVCHALTGNSDVFDWWNGLFGEGKLFNPNDYFIICANVIGSSYGSSGPISEKSEGGILNEKFPLVTPRDMANAHEVLRKELGIEKIDILIGASLGGQQALEWSIKLKENVKQLILIATNAQHSPFGIAFNESQRMVIKNDSTFGCGYLDDAQKGLGVARSIAMISYRSYSGYGKTQKEEDSAKINDFKASSYQRYQGQKLAKRFNAYAYLRLTEAMDAHNVGRNRGGVIKALSYVKAKTLVIGIDSDLLFPISEQQFLKEYIQGAFFKSISSDFGHDGFLVENEQLIEVLEDFINNDFNKNKITVFKQK